MNKNLIYIVGATVLVGGGAYLFLKNKKEKDLLKLAEAEKLAQAEVGTATGGATSGGATSGGATSGGATTPATATTLTAQQVLDKVKEDEAKSLATQIATLKTQKITLDLQKESIPLSQIGFGKPFNTAYTSVVTRIMALNKKISDLQLAIKKIGYKEVNGTAVKLVEVTTTKLV